MPNWVFTSMSVSGKEEDLRKFMDKAGKQYTTYHKGVRKQNEDGTWSYDEDAIDERVHDGVISFMNFATPTDLDAYFGSADYKPEGYDKMTTEERMAHAMRFSSDGWYDWNVRNWGTKWDACNPEMTNDDPTSGSIGYRFDTAWSPAEGAFQAMVSQHPELSFEFYNEEEQGWGVEFSGEDGELSVIKEWDIPTSHKDWEDLGQDCRACGYYESTEDQDDLFDDCPAKQKVGTDIAVQQMEDISELIG